MAATLLAMMTSAEVKYQVNKLITGHDTYSRRSSSLSAM